MSPAEARATARRMERRAAPPAGVRSGETVAGGRVARAGSPGEAGRRGGAGGGGPAAGWGGEAEAGAAAVGAGREVGGRRFGTGGAGRWVRAVRASPAAGVWTHRAGGGGAGRGRVLLGPRGSGGGAGAVPASSRPAERVEAAARLRSGVAPVAAVAKTPAPLPLRRDELPER